MPGRPFEDPSNGPTDDRLETVLAAACPAFRSLETLTGGFRHDWTFAKGSGWMLKVHDRSKALLYVIPLAGSFRLSLAIRESERDASLADPALAPFHDRLVSARKFAEGYALQFDVFSEPDLAAVEPFLTKLIALRT